MASGRAGRRALAVAGFNFRRFQEERNFWIKTPATTSSFMQTRSYPMFIKQMQKDLARAVKPRVQTDTTLGSMTTTAMADSTLADTQNSTRIYQSLFRKVAVHATGDDASNRPQISARPGPRWSTCRSLPSLIPRSVMLQECLARGRHRQFLEIRRARTKSLTSGGDTWSAGTVITISG